MKGPAQLVRSGKIPECKDLAGLFEWGKAKATLPPTAAPYRGKFGAILCYYNPPVHQVGNRELDAYLLALNSLLEKPKSVEFLVLCGANDPIHAGGDLRETLSKLDTTAKLKREKLPQGADAEDIDSLYDWADIRIKKGGGVHNLVRQIAKSVRTVAVCGGGTRFGGSAEIPLTADYLIADSRSGLCFSEAMLGIIPGWSGVARMLVKGGLRNAAYMTKLGKEVKADRLREIGVFNQVVEMPFGFPKRSKTDNPEADNAKYQTALDAHDDETGLLLLPKALDLAICPVDRIPVVPVNARKYLDEGQDVPAEIARRPTPQNYAPLRGKPLKDVQDEIARLGRPLAPQSVKALDDLLKDYNPDAFDENDFVQREMEADARLYRDPRYRVGVVAALEQTVPDFTEREADQP